MNLPPEFILLWAEALIGFALGSVVAYFAAQVILRLLDKKKGKR